MSVNDDVMSGSDSFWEMGRYSRTVKRSDNGHVLCQQLRKLIEERSEIEKKYSSELTSWAKRWNNYLDKGPEYGTTQGAWRGLLTEADHVADLHTVMAEKLMFEVHGSIKVWQKENYHKKMMHFKETKDFDENFQKAQKPWGKRLSKVMATKKEYHTACKTEKSTANQENNARGDTTVSQDQLKKLQDKLRKCQQDVEGTREKYNASVNDLNGYNAKYIEDMTEVYSRCQEFEQKRIDFFKKTLFQLHACLDLSVESKYSQIYTNLHTTIGNVDPNKDLKWWSNHHGVDMAMAWPTFEELEDTLSNCCNSKRKYSTKSLKVCDKIMKITSEEFAGRGGYEPLAFCSSSSSSSSDNQNNNRPLFTLGDHFETKEDPIAFTESVYFCEDDNGVWTQSCSKVVSRWSDKERKQLEYDDSDSLCLDSIKNCLPLNEVFRKHRSRPTYSRLANEYCENLRNLNGFSRNNNAPESSEKSRSSETWSNRATGQPEPPSSISVLMEGKKSENYKQSKKHVKKRSKSRYKNSSGARVYYSDTPTRSICDESGKNSKDSLGYDRTRYPGTKDTVAHPVPNEERLKNQDLTCMSKYHGDIHADIGNAAPENECSRESFLVKRDCRLTKLRCTPIEQNSYSPQNTESNSAFLQGSLPQLITSPNIDNPSKRYNYNAITEHGGNWKKAKLKIYEKRELEKSGESAKKGKIAKLFNNLFRKGITNKHIIQEPRTSSLTSHSEEGIERIIQNKGCKTSEIGIQVEVLNEVEIPFQNRETKTDKEVHIEFESRSIHTDALTTKDCAQQEGSHSSCLFGGNTESDFVYSDTYGTHIDEPHQSGNIDLEKPVEHEHIFTCSNKGGNINVLNKILAQQLELVIDAKAPQNDIVQIRRPQNNELQIHLDTSSQLSEHIRKSSTDNQFFKATNAQSELDHGEMFPKIEKVIRTSSHQNGQIKEIDSQRNLQLDLSNLQLKHDELQKRLEQLECAILETGDNSKKVSKTVLQKQSETLAESVVETLSQNDNCLENDLYVCDKNSSTTDLYAPNPFVVIQSASHSRRSRSSSLRQYSRKGSMECRAVITSTADLHSPHPSVVPLHPDSLFKIR